MKKESWPRKQQYESCIIFCFLFISWNVTDDLIQKKSKIEEREEELNCLLLKIGKFNFNVEVLWTLYITIGVLSAPRINFLKTITGTFNKVTQDPSISF